MTTACTCSSPDDKGKAAIIPTYDTYKRILLLGEADFSFTRAFAKAYMNPSTCCSDGNSTPNAQTSMMEITATEYGSRADITNRYHDGDSTSLAESMNFISQLAPVKEMVCGLNARRLGDVDCTCQRWNAEEQQWDAPSQFWQHDARKFDLIIFNFPHAESAGRAAKLVKATFKQIRICLSADRLFEPDVVLEMRLRYLEMDPKLRKNIRAQYQHQEAAVENEFELLCEYESDLSRWERLGYQHKWTRRNASIRDVGLGCKVWRWTPMQS
jgi:hypothetical protein